MSMMENMNKMLRFCSKKNLTERFGLLDAKEKAYAAHLVKRYGYPVNIAIQRAYILGFDAYPYDYRNSRATTETMTATDFGM